MCIPSLFSHLHGILSRENPNDGLLRTACYLVIALVSNNSKKRNSPHSTETYIAKLYIAK